MNAKHVGGAYAGEDESEAQRQFGQMLAQTALSGVVKSERAERINQMDREQRQLLRWRLPWKKKK